MIKEAHALKDNTDWKETTGKFKNLQKQWTKTGSAGHKFEQVLWKKFRAACDHFFNAKKEYYDTLDDRLAENLNKKQAFIEKLKKVKVNTDKEKGREEIQQLVAEWNELGMVPKKNAKEINTSYKEALDKLYQSVGYSADEAEKVKYFDKIEEVKKKDKSEKLLKDELRFVKEKIDQYNQEAAKLENNLNFFRFAKGKEAEKMKSEAEEKVQKAKDTAAEWAEKKKMIQIALRKLKDARDPVKEEVEK